MSFRRRLLLILPVVVATVGLVVVIEQLGLASLLRYAAIGLGVTVIFGIARRNR